MALMGYYWSSQQGSNRSRNGDASAVVLRERWCFGIIADESEKHPGVAGLAAYWTQSIASAVGRFEYSPDKHQLLEVMRTVHGTLRQHFLMGRASYAGIVVDLEHCQMLYFHCGDCRVGIVGSNEPLWLTTDHTVEQTLPALRARPQGLTLARSLNAKRFSSADFSISNVSGRESIILATDGYVSAEEGDDVSCLKLTWESKHRCSDSECSNFFAP